jgi:hypothetical protein
VTEERDNRSALEPNHGTMPVIEDEKLLDREELLARMHQRQEETGQVLPPGSIYTASEPEFVGRMPIRTEIEVIPADNPKQLTVSWLRSGMTVMAWGMSWTVVRNGFSLILERDRSNIYDSGIVTKKIWDQPKSIVKRLVRFIFAPLGARRR